MDFLYLLFLNGDAMLSQFEDSVFPLGIYSHYTNENLKAYNSTCIPHCFWLLANLGSWNRELYLLVVCAHRMQGL